MEFSMDFSTKEIVRHDTKVFSYCIVMSTLTEPEAGWVENLNGPSGIIASAGTCMLSALHCSEEKIAEVAPVDSCANIMLAIAWYLANYRYTNYKFININRDVENY
jgi:fatty acyl-CoA reductase